MDIFQLKIEESGGYILPCLLLAAAYSYILYRKKDDFFSPSVRYMLAGLRFLAVFLICFLLLSPFINYTKNTFENPVVAFVVDNSSSITMEQSADYEEMLRETLKKTESALRTSEIETAFFDLNTLTNVDSIRFSHDETNLSQALKETKDTYFNRNLAAIIVVSDGIYNRGTSPSYLQLNKPIYSLGTGDTTVQKDIAISEVKTNKTAYINNSFPIKATVQHHGYVGQQVTVSLSKKDTLIGTKKITLSSATTQDVVFLTSESKTGIGSYRLEVTHLDDEVTHKNNSKNVFVEIVNNKEKILLYALAPHPDIKTIRKIVDRLDRYEFEIFVEGITKSELNPKDYHLIIPYQVPVIGKTGRFTDRVLTSDVPKLFIVGNQTDLKSFSVHNKTLVIQGNNNQKDEVNAFLEKNFDKFTTDQAYINSLLPNTPPVAVPFAEYRIKGNTTGLLYQQVGSIQTDKPLLLLQHTNDFKEGVLIGEGYWRWALFEYAEKQENKLLDEIFSKTIQFLVSKDDKRKLIVNPKKSEFYTSEGIDFEIQTLNDLLEPLSGIPVFVSISQNGEIQHKYDFLSDQYRQSFPMTRLEEGNYNFTATATISNKKHLTKGAFTVKKKQLEELDLQANHLLLNELSNNNNGKFYPIEKYDDLVEELISQNFKKVIHSQETNKPLRETWWYLLAIVTLLAAEWTLRKVKGSRI